MRLSPAQLERFHEDGFLVLPGLFSREEVDVLRAELSRLCAEDCPANIREKLSGEVRTAMGLHARSEVFARLCRHPRFVGPARQILGTDRLYIQQAKVNAKAAFSGEAWQWHYDFATHHHEDGVPEPLALNLRACRKVRGTHDAQADSGDVMRIDTWGRPSPLTAASTSA